LIPLGGLSFAVFDGTILETVPFQSF